MKIQTHTPWELHEGILVKREDLSCPPPGPSFSKVRGLTSWLKSLRGQLIPPTCVGVLDTRHSKAGWGVSYLAPDYGFPVRVYYPVFKNDKPGDLRESQAHAQELGATLVPLRGNLMSAVLWNIAKKDCVEHGVAIAPNVLKFTASVEATAQELTETWPEDLIGPVNVVVSASSATLASGVALGLSRLNRPQTRLIVHLGYSRSHEQVLRYMASKGVPQDFISSSLDLIDEGYAYADRVDTPVPFPCNPYYDRKAWKWIMENRDSLVGEIVLWNIGE